MIESIYIKNYLSFNETNVKLGDRLNVFSGSSGAGKSIFFNAILSIFANKSESIDIGEVIISDTDIENEQFGIEKNDFSIKQVSSQKTRYYLNNQLISKKDLLNFTRRFFIYLNLKNTKDFSSEAILELCDFIGIKEVFGFKEALDNFKNSFYEYVSIENKLVDLKVENKKIEKERDFLAFEISRIDDINPQIGEYEELKDIKDKIKQKEKAKEYLDDANFVLQNSYKVSKLLEIIGKDSLFFDEAINEANLLIEDFCNFDSEENIDKIVNRIEELSKLIKKYGSIEEALAFKEKNQEKLNSLSNIESEIEFLEKKILKYKDYAKNDALKLSHKRAEAIEILENRLNLVLNSLYLPSIKLSLQELEYLSKQGIDEVSINLQGSSFDTVSSGEFNRLRLALLKVKSNYILTKGVLFLDEIDSNVSGKESEAIAKVLKELSKTYQIVAISHQPHLCAMGDRNFLVYKEDNKSYIKVLNEDEKVDEIARMVSGKEIKKEAILFAKKLIKGE